ncbi:hypothetical protein C3943_19955 [Lysinibacillus sp. B2A1]|nr:hypothetical protein C3943_19955 [Lysinibacillus sp. B2A1]
MQLVFNGYYVYIFETPLAETLKKWESSKIGELLEKMKLEATAVNDYLVDKKCTLTILSNLYKVFPEFYFYDKIFCENTGYSEVAIQIKKTPEW